MCVCNKVKEVFPVHGNILGKILGKGMDQLICAMVVTKTMELILISLVVKVSCFSKNDWGKKKFLCLRRAEE